MATGHFEVDTDYLRRSTTELQQYLQILKNTHGDLRDKMAEVSGMWEGTAKEAFHLQFQNDCAEFVEVCKLIDEAIDALSDAAKEYDACDERVRSIVNAIKV